MIALLGLGLELALLGALSGSECASIGTKRTATASGDRDGAGDRDGRGALPAISMPMLRRLLRDESVDENTLRIRRERKRERPDRDLRGSEMVHGQCHAGGARLASEQ